MVHLHNEQTPWSHHILGRSAFQLSLSHSAGLLSPPLAPYLIAAPPSYPAPTPPPPRRRSLSCRAGSIRTPPPRRAGSSRAGQLDSRRGAAGGAGAGRLDSRRTRGERMRAEQAPGAARRTGSIRCPRARFWPAAELEKSRTVLLEGPRSGWREKRARRPTGTGMGMGTAALLSHQDQGAAGPSSASSSLPGGPAEACGGSMLGRTEQLPHRWVTGSTHCWRSHVFATGFLVSLSQKRDFANGDLEYRWRQSK
jgi:hypothetical protein